METAPCLSAFQYLTKHEIEPISEYRPSGSAPWYISMRRIKALFEDEPDGLKLESIFLCPCKQCVRDGGLVEARSANFNSLREHELRNEYVATYALLIYILRPGLIRIFQEHELKLHGTSYLRKDDFLVLRNQNLFDFDDLVNKVLRRQYSFLIRTLRSHSDIIAIPSKELLPIKEDPEAKGVGSFAQVRCFEFQDEEYRSQDFGQITRFARKIFKDTLAKSALKEWYNLQTLSKAINHQHLMPALGAYWHGNSILFILQEEANMSLHDYLSGKGDKYDSNELWNQMRGLADGLDKLHKLYRETKIAYHQDLKPANILIVRGTLKIADFGLLEFRPVSLDDTGTTGVVTAHNTGYYAAPRLGRYTREDDIWSLACIVSELATSDVQGRDEVAKYKEARIADGPSGKDTPRFFLEQRVKSQVLERHRKLQRTVQPWNSADESDETRRFQGKFFNAEFFIFLNRMFRHGQPHSTHLEVSGRVNVPDAGQVAEIIERLRKEALPVPSLKVAMEEPGGSTQRPSRVSEDLVFSLEDTLGEFRQSLSRKDERKFRLTTFADLKQFLVNLQARQYAEGRQQALKRLFPLIENFEQFGQFLGEFCGELCDSNDFMAFIWGPINFILETTSTHENAFNEILSIYRQIGLNQPLRSQYEELLCSQPEMGIILSAAYSDIIRVHKLTLIFFKQRRWRDLYDTTWIRYKSRFLRYITHMGCRLDLVTHRGTVLQFSDFQNSCVMEDEKARSEIDMEDLKRRQAIYTWLKAIEMENEQHHFATIRSQYPDTGRWLLEHTTFKEWFDPQFTTLPTLLWLHGKPGAGKTVLASMVVEAVRNLSPKPTILSFFFKEGERDRDNFVSMARCLLSQLLQQDAGILDYVYMRCCNSGQAFLTSRILIEELLHFSLSNCASAYIVLDGLDECCSREERRTIVEFFCNLIENLDPDPDRIRCLFVSRKDSARKDFSGLANIAVDLENNEDDIDTFSHVQSQKLRELGVSDQRLQEIVDFVSAFAEGIFLVAELVWINLCGQTSIESLEQEMDSLPTDLDKLDEAYARIMRTILKKPVRDQREGALRLLGWLVCAKRPLKLHEVQTMKSINLKERTVEFERRRFRVDPKDLCESLVDVRPDGSIELVHLTARVYLLKNNALDIAAEEIGLATLCVDYLNLPFFKNPFSKEAVLDGSYGFMEYAILNWVRHLEAGLSSRSIPDESIKGFFESFETLLEHHWNNPTIEVKIPKRTRDILDIFQYSPKHKEIQQAIASTQEQAKRFGNMRPAECALDFTEVVVGIRSQLETVISDSADKSIDEDLKLKYGIDVFKCPRFSCKYFTQGFASKVERDRHVERHERPARCTDRHCTGFIIGFATESQLARHLKETHSDSTDHGHSFPTEEEVDQSMREYSPETSPEPEAEHIIVEDPEPDPEPEPEPATRADDVAQPALYSRPAKRTKAVKEHECSYCGKKFTKRYNWQSHLETHAPSQTFTCSTCGTTCARESDFKRHSKTHMSGNTFKCGGILKNGQAWGCGQSFNRADTLRNHYKSKKGRKCIAASNEEEQAQIEDP